MATDGTLSPKQYRAIECLLASGNVAESAKRAGVGRRTLHRWITEDPAFAKALRDAEEFALQGLTRSLMALGDKATEALAAVFDDPNASHAVKIKAAGVVFRNHPHYLHATDVVERLGALEELESERQG